MKSPLEIKQHNLQWQRSYSEARAYEHGWNDCEVTYLWRNTEDMLPEVGQQVITAAQNDFTPDINIRVEKYDGNVRRWTKHNVKFWMPIPDINVPT